MGIETESVKVMTALSRLTEPLYPGSPVTEWVMVMVALLGCMPPLV